MSLQSLRIYILGVRVYLPEWRLGAFPQSYDRLQFQSLQYNEYL